MAVIASLATAANATDVKVGVWAVATPFDNYRVDAIDIAADILEREAAIRGQDLNITVEKTPYSGWDDFKQALTLSAEAGDSARISSSPATRTLRPGRSRASSSRLRTTSTSMPGRSTTSIPNLIEISSYGGTVYGIPQDAELRPFFFWKPHMKAIGYTDEQTSTPCRRRCRWHLHAWPTSSKTPRRCRTRAWFSPATASTRASPMAPTTGSSTRASAASMEEDGKLVFDKAAMTRFYQYFVDAVAAGVTKKNHIGMDADQWWAEVASGKAGIWHGGTWHYARYVNQEGLTDFFGNVAFTLIPARRRRQAEYPDPSAGLPAHRRP